MTESRLLVVADRIQSLYLQDAWWAKSGISPATWGDLTNAFLEDIRNTVESLPPESGIRFIIHPQARGIRDPGDQMAQLFDEGFAAGARSVCVIGTSAPHLPASYILEAFGRLMRHPTSAVLGPADSGSYYLIGASGAPPYALWKDISWGTINVLKETLHRAVSNELSVSLLPSLQDVKKPEHLQRLARDLRRGVVVAPHTQHILRKIGIE